MTVSPPYSNEAPLHVQVRELIRQQALSGELVDENGRLPTEAALGKKFGVSRITIRSALEPLVRIGMFDRTPGRGTFLRNNCPEHWSGRLLGFQETIHEQGLQPDAKILAKGMTNRHDNEVRKILEERAVWQLRRVRYANDTPIAIEHAYYPPDIGIELENRGLIDIRMYDVLENELGHEIKSARQTISAKLSSSDEQKWLDLDHTVALTSMKRVTISTKDRPLELLYAVYHPAFYQFSIDLSRR